MRTKLLLLAALLLSTVPTVAQGQILPRSVELDFQAGYYSFMSRGT